LRRIADRDGGGRHRDRPGECEVGVARPRIAAGQHRDPVDPDLDRAAQRGFVGERIEPLRADRAEIEIGCGAFDPALLGQHDRPGIGRGDVMDTADPRLQPAKRDIALRDLGRDRQPDIVEPGDGGVRLGVGRLGIATMATEQVELPARVDLSIFRPGAKHRTSQESQGRSRPVRNPGSVEGAMAVLDRGAGGMPGKSGSRRTHMRLPLRCERR